MDQPGRAYPSGLDLLARRELSEAQLRARLARRGFSADDIDDAVTRLRDERALDDRRVALACARREAGGRHRGRARVVRKIESLGIARDVARAAAAEVYAEIDEAALLEGALDRRLRGGASLAEEATQRRVHRALVAQGFDAATVASAIASRIKGQEPGID